MIYGFYGHICCHPSNFFSRKGLVYFSKTTPNHIPHVIWQHGSKDRVQVLNCPVRRPQLSWNLKKYDKEDKMGKHFAFELEQLVSSQCCLKEAVISNKPLFKLIWNVLLTSCYDIFALFSIKYRVLKHTAFCTASKPFRERGCNNVSAVFCFVFFAQSHLSFYVVHFKYTFCSKTGEKNVCK